MPSEADESTNRARPERNPFACSRCGCYLGLSKRVGDTDDYCDGCVSEVLGPYAL